MGPVGVVFKGSGFYATDNCSLSGLSTPKKDGSSSSEKSESKTKTESAKLDCKSSGKNELATLYDYIQDLGLEPSEFMVCQVPIFSTTWKWRKTSILCCVLVGWQAL